ncbi:MAG: fibronectin type III domain-containing protein [bacterium]
MKITRLIRVYLALIICSLCFFLNTNLTKASTPPTAITDLAVSTPTFQSITLTWTSPGADLPDSYYDIRYSTSKITDDNWDLANQVQGEPLPQEAGISQSMIVSLLSPATSYFFAMKTHNNEGVFSNLSNVVNIVTAQEPSHIVHISQCGVLSESDTYYILDNNVTCDGTCFTITGSNIILDLNGYTVIYDDLASGLPNPGFELGDGEVPQDWDLTGAPTAKRRPTSEKVMNRKWYLKFEQPSSKQTIVSPWTTLPQNHKARANFIRGEKVWKEIISLLLEVEHETDGVITSFNDEKLDQLEFTTLDKPGRYRLKLTYTPFTSSPWQANHDYNLGDVVLPSEPNGFCYRVSTDNGVSGETEPVWITWASSTTNDKDLVWTTFSQTKDVTIDLLDLRPVENYGISIKYNRKGNIIIKNGWIVQGKGGGFRDHSIYYYGSPQITVENVSIETWGVEAGSIVNRYSDNCNIHHSIFINNNPYVFNRMQLSAAIEVQSGVNCNIFNNTIICDIGWGTVYLGDTKDSGIYNNILKTKTTMTNHHSIAIYENKNVKIFGNKIEADPGQGILVSTGSSNIEILENRIECKSIGPNIEYGSISFDGIRLNDYFTKTTTNVKIINNHIYMTGDCDEYYEEFETYHVNGILTLATGENIIVKDNYIDINVIDDNVCGAGISPGSVEENEVIFENNEIRSNSSNIMLTSYSSKCHYSTFISNKFIKNTNTKGLCSDYYRTYPPPQYCTLSSRYCQTSIKNTHFIDTYLGEGTSLQDFYLCGCLQDYSYFVDWYLYARVKDASGNPIAGANIEIKDFYDNLVFSGTTDPYGRYDRIILNQFEHYGNGAQGTSYFKPEFYEPNQPQPSYTHTVYVSATDFKPQTFEIKMTESKTAEITLLKEHDGMLYSGMDSDEEINDPTFFTEKVSGWETGVAVVESGTGEVTYEAGYSGMAVRLNGSYGNNEQVVFEGDNFDFYDLDGDGGRLDFWLKFNVDPHQAGEFYILRTKPCSDFFDIDLLGQNGDPYLIFEFFGNANNPKTGGDRFLVYTRGWDKWENWQQDEWHRITLTWKRNPEEADDELHLYIDGTQEGCTSCNDTGGILPTPDSEDWIWTCSPDDLQVVIGNYYDLAIDMSVDELTSFSSLTDPLPLIASVSSNDTIPPMSPINLTAETISSMQINLTWDAPFDNIGIAGYKIYRDGANIGTTVNTFYSDMGVPTENSTYTYKVSAFDAAGNESWQSFPANLLVPSNLLKPRPPRNLRMQVVK